MEDNILGRVAEAESRAAEIKAQALEQAAKIVAEAEKNAADISRSSEKECAAYRERAIDEAQSKAANDYEKSIEESRAEAKNYAASLLKFSSVHVSGIIGRLTK